MLVNALVALLAVLIALAGPIAPSLARACTRRV